MKRYLLFAGETYYPRGGWSDFKGAFETADQAMEERDRWLKDPDSWAHVIDSDTRQGVEFDAAN